MPSKDVQFHGGAFSNCSVTFNVNYTKQLSSKFFQLEIRFLFSYI